MTAKTTKIAPRDVQEGSLLQSTRRMILLELEEKMRAILSAYLTNPALLDYLKSHSNAGRLYVINREENYISMARKGTAPLLREGETSLYDDFAAMNAEIEAGKGYYSYHYSRQSGRRGIINDLRNLSRALKIKVDAPLLKTMKSSGK